MKKIKQLTFVLFIFSVLAFSYPVTQVFAQGGQCDSSPVCNPASGTCCGQCDSSPTCNPNDPNGIPCCGLEGNNMTNGSHPPPWRIWATTASLEEKWPWSTIGQGDEKMKHELQACQSLKEEIRGQQQTARRQVPARCQPDSVSKSEHRATQRQLNMAMLLLKNLCDFINNPNRERLTPLARDYYQRYIEENCIESYQESQLRQARTGRYKYYQIPYDGYQCTLLPNTNECEEDSP